MRTLGASLAAMLAGWVIDDTLAAYLGMGASLLLSFVGSTIVFFVALKWLKDLRGQ